MLIHKDKKYISTKFVNEQELENVVIDNYEYLFGPDSFFLPKKKIKTSDGTGTTPDGFAIDLRERKWYVVEAELGHHPVWDHIVKQVSKQISASLQTDTKRKLEEVSVQIYNEDINVKEKFDNLDIKAVDVRKIIGDILLTNPIIGIPIDYIPNDLRDWSYQQKFEVKLWIIRKFTEFKNSSNIIYEMPDERPVIDTSTTLSNNGEGSSLTQFDVSIFDLIESELLNINDELFMSYKPRNSAEKKSYVAKILPDGSMEVLGNLYSSPSYAALAGIQDAGSDRETVNGWITWKTKGGQTLADIRDIYLKQNESTTK